MEKAFCMRCLLQDLDDTSYYQAVANAVSAIPEDLRTPEPLYNQRLAACRECGQLHGGTCAVCGCFVEYRAASISSRCPQGNPLWLQQNNGSSLS